jgi:hypothetical protein
MCELDRLVRIQDDRIKPPAACEPLAEVRYLGNRKTRGDGWEGVSNGSSLEVEIMIMTMILDSAEIGVSRKGI